MLAGFGKGLCGPQGSSGFPAPVRAEHGDCNDRDDPGRDRGFAKARGIPVRESRMRYASDYIFRWRLKA
jgi:hypothetical protein